MTLPEGRLEDGSSWLRKYTIQVTVENLGVAFPLALDDDLMLPKPGYQSVDAVRAFLFSIKTICFSTHRGESGQATMVNFSFQFVPL